MFRYRAIYSRLISFMYKAWLVPCYYNASDDTFIIVGECQNMTFEHIKGLMTRIGKYSKVVLCGDVNQVSPMFKKSGLAEYLEMVEYFDMNVHTIKFTRDDVLRGDVCKEQIIGFENWESIKLDKTKKTI